jgi:hypothetical protein
MSQFGQETFAAVRFRVCTPQLLRLKDHSFMETLLIELRLNDRELDVTTVEKLGAALDVVDAEEAFELWASVPTGPVMSMLRNGSSAWLMYLREPGDSGFRSSGNESRQGVAEYRLSNGQVDEYPLSWCIDVEQCYKAIAYFCVNGGEKPEWIDWIPSDDMLGLAPQPRHD